MPSNPEQPLHPEPGHPTKLRITCVIHSLDGGGAERVMAGLASRLANRHSVTLVTLDNGDTDRHPVSERVQRHNLGVLGQEGSHTSLWHLPGRILAAADRNRQLRVAIRRSRPDVVLSFCDSMNVRTLLALRGGRFPPVVVVERSDPVQQSLGRMGDWLRRKLYRQAAAIVAQTETQAAALRDMTDRTVDVVPSAVEAPPTAPDRSKIVPEDATQTILSVGRLEHEKGFDRLLEAFATLRSDAHTSNPPTSIRLRIVGEGGQRKHLETLANELEIQDVLEMPGWVRPIWPEYESANLFVLPSRYEGFPSALLEAMAVGLPCVAVDCESGPREIIRHGIDGWLTDNSIDGLVDGIRHLQTDAQQRESLAGEAPKVIERFGWDSLVQRFESILLRAASA